MLNRDERQMTNEALGRRIRALHAWASRERERTSPSEGPLSQAKFAGLAGIKNNTLNQWAMGHGRPGLDEAIKLALRWSITLDWIYFGDLGGLPHRTALELTEELRWLENKGRV